MNNENREKIRGLFSAGIIMLCFFVPAINITAAANNPSDKSVAAPGIAVPKEMEQFVKFQAVDSGMNYIKLKETIKKDQLPLLYQLLSDAGYAPYWHNIARIIGYISGDPNSIPGLLTYFQRDDGSMVESISGKIYSIALIGKIGGEKADPILKKAITKEGVEELAKSWINKEEWKKGNDKRNKDQIVAYTQGTAFAGLVFSGKKENWDLVEKLYNEQKEISLKGQQTDIMSALIDAMMKKAYIADHNNDVESYFRIDWQLRSQILRPYIEKYTLRNALNK